MGDEKEIRAVRSGWFEGAGELINRSEKTDHDGMTWIENQVRSGAILIYRVEENGKMVGIFTGCVEREYGIPNNFLVIHAVSVSQQKRPFILTLRPIIESIVKRSGLKSWTVRSLRPGMDRRLERAGFRKTETIYKSEVM
jgi:hypothetical protein